MTPRLVDKANVVALPVGNLRDIAASARAFADLIDSGEIETEHVIIVSVIGGCVDFAVWGESPSTAEGVGLLELAKAKVISGAWRELP